MIESMVREAGMSNHVIRKTGIMILTAVAFWLGTQQAHAGKKDDTLVVAVQRGIRSLDRLYTRQREALILAQLTDDGLFYADPKTLRFVPLAAKSYKFIDETTLDVVVRRGVKFHDGSPLTADDVVYTYKWARSRKGRTLNTKKLRRWMKSVEKTSPMKVRFRLNYPYPMALRDMGISIYLRKKGSYDSTRKKSTNRRSLSYSLNGLGPYRVVQFDPGKVVILERFEGYYASSPKGRPAIKRIIFNTIPSWGAQQAAMMSGNVQWMYSVHTKIAENLGNTPKGVHLVGPSLRVGFVVMDAVGYTGKNNPFTKIEVRRAMNHAINREAIVKQMMKGNSRVIHSACHPAQFGCAQDVKKYDYNPAKAKELLRKAGYPNGFEFVFWAYRERRVAEAIVAHLTRAGIRAKLRYVRAHTLGRARRSREVAAYFGTWGSGSTADTSMIAGEHFAPRSNRNMSKDKDVQKFILTAERTLDPKKREYAYRKGLQLIAERALWIPLFSYSMNYVVSKDLDFVPPKDGLPRLFLARWK